MLPASLHVDFAQRGAALPALQSLVTQKNSETTETRWDVGGSCMFIRAVNDLNSPSRTSANAIPHALWCFREPLRLMEWL